MSDPVAKAGGSDRAVARALASIAAAAPARPAQPATTPVRDPQSSLAPADVAVVSVAASLAAKPPVDSDRVAQIKRAVANGTFPILPATIADRLLALRYDWMSDDPASA